MTPPDKPRKRRYDAPGRAAQAARTRNAMVAAAMQLFELHGWSGTTVNAVAERAGVSRQTVEAGFGTKAALLSAAVDLSIRGDTDPVPMPRRDVVAEMERAADGAAMLDLHARHIRTVNGRSARMAWVVEHAAASSPAVAELWSRMTANRRYAVGWAATTFLAKPNAPALAREDVEEAFWVGIDWRTYRSLTDERGLGAEGFERWLRRYYGAMFGV